MSSWYYLFFPKDTETGPKLREEFARVCFEILLQFSLLHEEQRIDENKAPTDRQSEITSHLAITALLDRFQKVLVTFAQDNKTNGECPLPRYYDHHQLRLNNGPQLTYCFVGSELPS